MVNHSHYAHTATVILHSKALKHSSIPLKLVVLARLARDLACPAACALIPVAQILWFPRVYVLAQNAVEHLS